MQLRCPVRARDSGFRFGSDPCHYFGSSRKGTRADAANASRDGRIRAARNGADCNSAGASACLASHARLTGCTGLDSHAGFTGYSFTRHTRLTGCAGRDSGADFDAQESGH